MTRPWAKAAHDRLFAHWVYRVTTGPMAGYRRRGRMPWLQPTPNPKLAQETRFLEDLGLRGAVVYDIGANIGTHMLLFHRLVGPEGQVHAFEPDPFFRRALLDLVVLNGLTNVEVHGYALGPKSGTAPLVVPDSTKVRASASLADEVVSVFGDHELRRTNVRVTRLDALAEALGLPPPDFLKVDVEGFEVEVLEGATALLRARRPRLFIEVHGASPEKQRARAQRVLQTLSAVGYRRFHHLEQGAPVSADDPPAGGHILAGAPDAKASD